MSNFLSYQRNASLPMVSAHRGSGEYAGFPENALESFQYILMQTPAILEFDVAMTKDSTLILMHDNTLDRTTTCTGEVKNKTWEEIQSCYLEDNEGRKTPFKIPRYTDALQFIKGKAIATVDVKRGVPYEKIVKYIEAQHAEDYAAVITYNLADAQQVHRLNPNLMISVTIRNEQELQQTLDGGIHPKNILAFTGTREANPALYEKLHELGILTIFGTLGGHDEKAEKMSKKRSAAMYRQFVRSGVDIVATDRPIEAAKAIRKLTPRRSKQLQYFKGNK
ncbi:MAG: glycerophosphodiester phosphodiesterase family protein [Saprospiraceae bacterium]